MFSSRLHFRSLSVVGLIFAATLVVGDFGEAPGESGVPAPDRVAKGHGGYESSPQTRDPDRASDNLEHVIDAKVNRTIHAHVVAIDQPYMINRLGASQPAGMIFVLRCDLKFIDSQNPVPFVKRDPGKPLGPDNFKSNFKLRDGKRPRPIVLRMNVEDVLEIEFENWLQPLSSMANTDTQRLAALSFFRQNTRYAGIHVSGLELVPAPMGNAAAKVGGDGIQSDGSWVGNKKTNPSGLLPPWLTATDKQKSITYRLYARETGAFLLAGGADTTVHQLNAGLFGAVNVQPKGAEWYRSQTTRCEMQAATLKVGDLRSLEQSLGDYQKPATDDQKPATADAAQTAPQTDASIAPGSKVKRQAQSLSTPRSRGRAPAKANVYVENGRIYSELHQPLINYQSVFKDEKDEDEAECPGAEAGKPILSMLKVKVTDKPKTEKKSKSLKPGADYRTEIEQLDNGFIPFSLREFFNEAPKIVLASDASVARVASVEKYSWVVTNPGKPATTPGADIVTGTTYLVQGHEKEVQGHEKERTVTIVECELHLVYSDLTAIITGPNAGDFPYSQDIPGFYTNPASPSRRQPYREFTIIYHQGGNTVQAFPQWSNNNLFSMINAGMDQFGINYGIAAIGPEIVANRLGVGPMGNAQQPVGPKPDTPVKPGVEPTANQPNDAVDLKYEEFFLSAWCVGDPAMIVDVPANVPNQMVSNPEKGSNIVGTVETNPVQFNTFKPLAGPRPTKAFYPDDPSNVYHSYMRDHTKMRVLHAGPGPAHVHHLHAHQWLRSPNSPEATYLDSQLILPGSAYTLEITYNGSGNRNQTVGDSIFHCHFYPHFAKGMWSLWRVHDTFEAGTWLDERGICVTRVDPANDYKPVCPILPDGNPNPAYATARTVSNRALPDGEINSGTPTPALIPLPTLAMAPLPAPVQVADLSPWYEKPVGMGRRIHVVPKNWQSILNKYDLDNDGKLEGPERAKWYQDIDDATAYNTKHSLEYGDPGYIKDVPAYNKRYNLARHDKGYIPDNYNGKHDLEPGDKGYQWKLYALWDNPGYPFFIPGVSGHRAPHPPLDMAWKASVTPEEKKGKDPDKAKWTKQEIQDELGLDPSVACVKECGVQYLDGGLPRHLVLGGDIVSQYQTRWDFSKDFVKTVKKDGKEVHIGGLYAFQLPEDGTPIEKAAMRAHSTRTHASRLPENGEWGNFILNGLPPIHGAPYADPSVTDDGNSSGDARRYQAAVIQTDVVLNKNGWHYPQSRFITLWEDVKPTISNDRAPEPFFIRTATNDATEFWHTNLVPNYYELDDFQVRTPTDVIGQHIHLVKFDVTASDGAGNGWNYEDGTFGPGEVRERIHAIMNRGGLYGFDPRTGYVDKATQCAVAVWKVKDAYPRRDGVDDPFGLFGEPPKGQDWNGAMTTIQRWAIDPLLNWKGHDRTLRTVFTHDHMAPSTHQQVGLYAGVLVEPQGSQWYLPDGQPMNTRVDGGPTSWQAMIVTANPENSHREYAIEFQDMHLAYTADSTVGPLGSNALFKPKLTGQALAKMKAQVKDYDGAQEYAPAAFYIGQATDKEAEVIQLLIQNALLQGALPPVFPEWFLRYGIQLDPNAKVTVLDPANTRPGHYGAQWLIQQPELSPLDPHVNAGDYYIVQATRPGAMGVPTALSVFTPAIHRGFADPKHAVNPNPGDDRRVDGKFTFYGNLGTPTGAAQGATISNSNFGNGAPFTSLVSNKANGTYSMNYRNEPVQLRVKSGNSKQTDLAYAFSSIERDKTYLNVQPKRNDPISTSTPPANPYKFPPRLIPSDVPGGPQGTDPFTPLIRGYVGDDIQIRTLVGAYLQPHAFTIHGVKWLAQPSYLNSGYRNVQSMGISEHFEMRFKMPSAVAARDGTKLPAGADYFYSASTGAVGLSNGLWGIMRSYNQVVGDPEKPETAYLKPLVNNPKEEFPPRIDYKQQFETAKNKPGKNVQEFCVVATTAKQALPNGVLTYNQRVGLADPYAVIFVREEDLDASGILKSGVPEPLVLRAAAGDWIKVKLKNVFASTAPPFNRYFSFRYGNPFNDLPRLPGDTSPIPTIGEVPLKMSQRVGLHPQLVAFDVTEASGINAGFNPDSTVGVGDSIDYYWYAGDLAQEDGELIATPVEFGATNLVGADLILQTQFGLVGALIIEPKHTTWTEDANSRAFATVYKPNGSVWFRECVLTMQNMVSNISPGREDSASQTGPREQGNGAVNYRTETFRTRDIGNICQAPPDLGFAKAFSDSLLNPPADPVTPVFTAVAGTRTRFRVIMPSTSSASSAAQPLVFAIHGHGWQDEPYIKKSTEIGHNSMAQFIGAQEVTVTQKYDIVLDSAGGPFQVPGDYLYQAYNQEQKIGVWGLFRVTRQ